MSNDATSGGQNEPRDSERPVQTRWHRASYGDGIGRLRTAFWLKENGYSRDALPWVDCYPMGRA